jgi:PrtD family type I secretion system ABC transporter
VTQARKRDISRSALDQALRRSRSAFFAVAVFSFFLNLLMLATPLYMLQVYGRVLTSGHLPTLFYLTVITMFALLIMGVLSTIRSWILSRLGAWLNSGLSGDLIAAGIAGTLDGRPTGSQPLRDLNQVQAFISGVGITALFDAPWVPVFIAAIWLMHPWLGYFGVASAIMLLALAVVNELLTRRPQRAAAARQSRAYQFVEASFRNAEAVQAMGMVPALLRRWHELSGDALDDQATADARAAVILGASRFLRLAVQVGILGLGALLVLQSEATPGQMIAASILLGRALAPVEQSIGAWRQFVVARAGYGRLNALLQATPGRVPAIQLPVPEGRILVDNLMFRPANTDKPILRQVSFALEPGTVLGILGPSAAGKSTLCRLLVGVWRPTVGCVRLDAAEVHTWNREQFGRYVGYLPQDVELFAGSVQQNIARLGEASDEEVIEAAQLAGVHEMILQLPNGYATQIGEGGAVLSAGQRQRIGLARAILRRPKFLVLDEPNSNLDQAGEITLRRVLRSLKQSGTTIAMVAHHAAMLEVADQLLVLRDGQPEALGPRDNVLSALGSRGRAAPAAGGGFAFGSARSGLPA